MAIFLTFSFIYNVCFAMFAELIYSTMEKIAVFPGSFDPFTVGHEEIVTYSDMLLTQTKLSKVSAAIRSNRA